MSEYPVTSAHGREMMDHLPGYYGTFREIRYLAQGEGVELDSLAQAIDGALDQYFVDTATWGLDRWENELGLAPAQDQPSNERRSRIVSRLRGTGTATIRVVRQVAESYDQGAVDVVEDFAAYTATVQFVDTRGVPPNLDDLKQAVRAVVPAHLALRYAFRYTLYSDLKGIYMYGDLAASGLTYGDLKTQVPA